MLFGSYAKRNSHPYRDIHLAVFSSQFVENPFENIKMIQGPDWLPHLELHLYPSKEFDEDFFVQEIKKHAVDLTYLTEPFHGTVSENEIITLQFCSRLIYFYN